MEYAGCRLYGELAVFRLRLRCLDLFRSSGLGIGEDGARECERGSAHSPTLTRLSPARPATSASGLDAPHIDIA